jgi:hypothetical protein
MKLKVAFVVITALALAVSFGARAQSARAETSVRTSPFSFTATAQTSRLP